MNLVEKHIIKKSNPIYNDLDNLCFLSKNLYNQALYRVRNHYFTEKKYLNYYSLNNQLSKEDQIDYRNLPAAVSQQTLMMLDKNFKSFFGKLKKKKERDIIKIPKYKDKSKGRFLTIFANNAFKMKNGEITFLKNIIPPIKTSVNKIRQVRIIPKLDHYVIEVIYDKEIVDLNLDKSNCIGIDLGVNNLMSLTSNVSGFKPQLINGRPLKSINHFYNKEIGYLQSLLPKNVHSSKQIKQLFFRRKCKVDNYLHNFSKYVIELCKENNIGTIVIGYNKEWKQSVKLGKRNNQNFVQIPYQNLINQITYKGKLVGIEVKTINEAYTSKCSALDLEPIKYHKEYLGKRVMRGLFKTSKGVLINSDINGSLSILRNVIGDDFIRNLTNIGTQMNAQKINKTLSLNIHKKETNTGYLK